MFLKLTTFAADWRLISNLKYGIIQCRTPTGDINVSATGDLASVVQRLETDLEQCMESLSQKVQADSTAIHTHHLLTITGIDGSAECHQDLAVYCVGQIAKAVQINLDIKADLLGVENEDARNQLIRDVYSVIGESNDDLTVRQKRDERDPWLFEALSHLLVHLSTKKKELLPVGTLIGLTMTHRGVNEPGLDLVAVYTNTTVGIGIGESKCREDDPSAGLREAAETFEKVDLGDYAPELRRIVGQMRYAMSADYQGQITGAFWENERAYLPFIGYDANHNPQWTAERDALRSLAVPVTHIILVPLPIEEFRDFFDALAGEMRTYLTSLEEQ